MKVKKCFACGKPFEPDDIGIIYCDDCREKEIRKSKNKMRQLDDPEPFKNLYAAVLRSAADDYINAIASWHRAYTEEKKLQKWYEICKLSYWFKSEDFRFWSENMNGSFVQRECNLRAKQRMKRITNMKLL